MRVPAKVNLFLAVRGRRDDAMHEIVTVMQTVTLFDVLTAALYGSEGAQHPAARKHMSVSFDHDGVPDVPDGDENLAVRAAWSLARTFGGKRPALRPASGHDAAFGSGVHGDAPVTALYLEKHIPVAAGMAGGSADAAGALVALNQLWECGMEREELRALAARLGADVPFCVTGGTALATGTGVATAQVLCRGTYHWVVGVQAEPLATVDVYRAWDEHAQPSEIEPDAVLHALRTDDAEALGAALHNDLEQAVFRLRPDLRKARDALLDAGAFGAVVSGSGPTLVALAGSQQHAQGIAEAVGAHFQRVEVARSPAGGPEIVDE